MTEKVKKNFSIRQTANACGIGRTTLQRLTDNGLIKPAEIGENRYHYYNAKNIYDINTIQLLSECGFTHRQLTSLDLSDSVMQTFANELQDKINILTFAMENLRDASDNDPRAAIKIINIPEMDCYVLQSTTIYDFETMSKLVETALGSCVEAGFKINKYYPPFTILDNEKLFTEHALRSHKCTVCIPLTAGNKGEGIRIIPQVSVLSVTYKYAEGNSRTFYKMLKDEIQRRGMTPQGPTRIEALFNPFINDERSATNIALRLSIPV